MNWIHGPMTNPSNDHTQLAATLTCPCGNLRLPGIECCGLHVVDDETAQALERIGEQTPAQKLAAYFLANADDGNNEANSDFVREMGRRKRERR